MRDVGFTDVRERVFKGPVGGGRASTQQEKAIGDLQSQNTAADWRRDRDSRSAWWSTGKDGPTGAGPGGLGMVTLWFLLRM